VGRTWAGAIVGPPSRGRPIQPAPASTAAGFGDTETGGSIGIWHFFPNLDKYVEGLEEMADVVGVITSASAPTSRPHPAVQDYLQWVQLVAEMLRGGFTSEEAGGNYMRIFRAAVGWPKQPYHPDGP
jgi:hypothetical protein